MKPIFLLMVALTIAGCGSSPPTRFYALEPTAPKGAVQLPRATPIKVDAVHIPSVLDRRTIVRGQNHYQLDISSQARWGVILGRWSDGC